MLAFDLFFFAVSAETLFSNSFVKVLPLLTTVLFSVLLTVTSQRKS